MAEVPARLMQVAQIFSCVLDNGLVVFHVRQPDGAEGFVSASPHTVIDWIAKAQMALVGRVLPWRTTWKKSASAH